LFPPFRANDAPTEVLWSAVPKNNIGKKRSASEACLGEEHQALSTSTVTVAEGNKKICVTHKEEQEQDNVNVNVNDTKEQCVSELVEETELSLFNRRKQSQPSKKSCPSLSCNIILRTLPREVLAHCLSFLDPVRDRANTARSCHTLNMLMMSPHIMRSTDLFGLFGPIVPEEGTGGDTTSRDEEAADAAHDERKMISFVNEDEDTKGLLRRLEPYLKAGNFSAMYM
jgi:hypothetical protein